MAARRVRDEVAVVGPALAVAAVDVAAAAAVDGAGVGGIGVWCEDGNGVGDGVGEGGSCHSGEDGEGGEEHGYRSFGFGVGWVGWYSG